MSLRARTLDFFVEPRVEPTVREPAAPAPPHPQPRIPGQRAFLAPAPPEPLRPAELAAAVRSGHPRPATHPPLRAAVLGTTTDSVPLGALLANSLRAAAGAPAAALALWAPEAATAAYGRPATIAASRLAARLCSRGLPAAARGRLAWLALEAHPVAATVAVRRAAGTLEVPLVTVLAGPRCDVVEALLAEQDLVVVAASEPDGPLARLAVAGCTAAALAGAPPASGPARWIARTGFLGAGALGEPLRSFVRELAADAAPGTDEVAW